MANHAALKQADLTRYAKALRAAGYSEWRVDVKPDGTVSIFAGKTAEASGSAYLDKLLE